MRQKIFKVHNPKVMLTRLCTMICLQWEPDVVSVALMYLASRLRKYDFTDWEGKQPGSRMKWWEGLVSDVNIDVLECRLYDIATVVIGINKYVFIFYHLKVYVLLQNSIWCLSLYFCSNLPPSAGLILTVTEG